MTDSGEVDLTLRELTQVDAETLAGWQTDALFCAHAGLASEGVPTAGGGMVA